MMTYKVDEDLEINVTCSLYFQMCPAVLWSFLCLSFTKHKQWTLFIHLLFFLKVTASAESCYDVTYGKILEVRYSSTQHPVFYYNLLHTLKKKQKGVIHG